MRRALVLLIAIVLGAPAARSAEPGGTSYADLRSRAEKLVAERSYALAHEIYARVEPSGLAPEERAWVAFRVADTRWRGCRYGGDGRRDTLGKAGRDLLAVLDELDRLDPHPRAWAEAQESLAELAEVADRGYADPESRDVRLVKALEWWASAPADEEARQRFLALVWKVGASDRPDYGWGNDRGRLAARLAREATTLARTAPEVCRSHLLLAQAMIREGGPASYWKQIPASFELAVNAERSPCTADAIHAYATWVKQSGRDRVGADGQVTRTGDLVKALALFRRLTSEFKPNEHARYHEAQQQVRELTTAGAWPSVATSFVPGSPAQAQLLWRSVSGVELELYGLDIMVDLDLEGVSAEGNWLDRLDPGRLRSLSKWTRQLADAGDLELRREDVALPVPPTPGCYLLVARTTASETRALVQVTDLVGASRSLPSRLLVWLTRQPDGSPEPEVRLRSWRAVREGGRSIWRRGPSASTDDQGLAWLDRGADSLLVLAAQGNRQAWIPPSWYGQTRESGWRAHVWTDRPLYRRGEEVHLSLCMRPVGDAEGPMPAGLGVSYAVMSPRGEETTSGTLALDEFGAASSSFRLPVGGPLGSYSGRVNVNGSTAFIDTSELFRVEEYRLPEFQVEVAAHSAGEAGSAASTESSPQVTVTATYYHGRPVAGAQVELLAHRVHERATNFEMVEAPWLARPPGAARESVSSFSDLRELLVTDANGRATFTLPTRQWAEALLQIEAHVTDVSRRVASGTARVRLSLRPVEVEARAKTVVVAAGSSVKVSLTARDANGIPVPWKGVARVAREVWAETWVDPDGRQVSGLELRKLKGDYGHPTQIAQGWRQLDNVSFRTQEIAVIPVEVPATGQTEVEVAVPRAGHYRVSFTPAGALTPQPWSPVGPTQSVELWAHDGGASDLDHYSHDVKAVLSRVSARPGDEVSALVLSPLPDRWVLLTLDGDDVERAWVVHLTGTTGAFTLPVLPSHVPNVSIQAWAFLPRRLSGGAAELIVSPEHRFLKLDLVTDKPSYLPGEQVEMRITARDSSGRPAHAQLALAVFDEAVLAIQPEVAGDIRATFYGHKRRTPYGFTQVDQARIPVRLVDVEGKLVDERNAERERAVAAKRREEERRKAGERALQPVPPPVPARGAEMIAACAVTVSGLSVVSPELPRPRARFEGTAFWQHAVRTDDQGEAVVRFSLPDSVTRWRAVLRGSTVAGEIGETRGGFPAAKPLQARLQAPRFLVEGDRAVVSVVVDNGGASQVVARPSLVATGARLERQSGAVSVAPGRAERADWFLAAETAGKVRLEAGASAAGDADAMVGEIPVLAHGIEKVLARAGELGEGELVLDLNLPRRKEGSTRVSLQVVASPAVAMLDALPSLVQSPHGCTEQTVNRFFPAVSVARAMERLKLSPAALTRRLRSTSPVADEGEHADLRQLDQILADGLARLKVLQNPDGGWGWCQGHDSEVLWTSYVLWGTSILGLGGRHGENAWLERGADYLESRLGPALPADARSFGLFALVSYLRSVGDHHAVDALRDELDALVQERSKLSAAGLALLALASDRLGSTDTTAMLGRNLANGAVPGAVGGSPVIDPESNGAGDMALRTVHWGADDAKGETFAGRVETTALAVLALRRAAPASPLIAAGERWLLLNRQGMQWQHGRETALAVLALTESLAAAGGGADTEVGVTVNGTQVAGPRLVSRRLDAASAHWLIEPSLLRDGRNEIRLRRRGGGASLWAACEGRFFSREEPIAAAGRGVVLRRQYFRLTPRPTLLRGPSYEKQELRSGDVVASGDRVEAVLTIEAPSDLAYLLLEDARPAGWEPVEVRSGPGVQLLRLGRDAAVRRFAPPQGEVPSQGAVPARGPAAALTGEARSAYRELRAAQVDLFLDRLPEGIWELRYILRAETSGDFHGLPAQVHAVYAPATRANSTEVRVEVVEPVR